MSDDDRFPKTRYTITVIFMQKLQKEGSGS